MQLAWYKHLTSQTLNSSECCEDVPEKMFISCVDSFREADHPPHLGRADLNLPKWIVASVNSWKVTDLNQITQPCMSSVVFLFIGDYLQFKRLPVPFWK